MKFLIIGCGGREYSIIKSLYNSNHTKHDIYCIGDFSNAGIISLIGQDNYELIEIMKDNYKIIADYCKKYTIDYVFIGPEKPLNDGLVDYLVSFDIKCIGPSKMYAQIETDKSYARQLMNKFNLSKYNPTVFDSQILNNNSSMDSSMDHIINNNINIGVDLGLESNMRDVIDDINKNTMDINMDGNLINNDTSNRYSNFVINNGMRNNNHFQNTNINFNRLKTFYENSIKKLNYDYVIKPIGLCSGKGVKVFQDHFTSHGEGLLYCSELLNNGMNFLIEERLVGKEFSLLSFCDGKTLIHMPPLMDFKRAYNNNMGPNTGSMGCISYADHSLPFLNEVDLKEAESINESVISALNNDINQNIKSNYEIYYQMAKDGFRGVLYGSYILTKKGLKVIEFNARFGDPECINLMEILDTDLGYIFEAIAEQNLYKIKRHVKFKNKSTLMMYLVPNGYPDNPIKGEEININIQGNDILRKNKESLIYASLYKYKSSQQKFITQNKSNSSNNSNNSNNSDTSHNNDTSNNSDTSHSNDTNDNSYKFILKGSRAVGIVVSNETDNIQQLNELANQIAKQIIGPIYYRTDIGITSLSYQDCGVDINNVTTALESASEGIKSTFNDNVIQNYGGFGGLISLNNICKEGHNTLVTSIDGVGTKTSFLPTLFGDEAYYIMGQDIVGHSINDILVQNAKPLFFMDYVASSKIEKEKLEKIIAGMVSVCKDHNCILIGGETAEMPGVYHDNSYDIVGTMVGSVNSANLINGKEMIQSGDVVIALPSNNIHTNGFSMIRRIFENYDIQKEPKLIKWMKAPHKPYYHEIMHLLENKMKIHGLCHITGGGLIDNPPRILPENLKMNLEYSFEDYPMFKRIKELGNISNEEMYRTFNCGIGMMVVVPDIYKHKVIQSLRIKFNLFSYQIGCVVDKLSDEKSVSIKLVTRID